MDVIKVKQDSIVKFFVENVIGQEELKSEGGSYGREENLYPLFKDELPIMKSSIKKGQEIEFEFRVRSLNERAELVYKYLYNVFEYDDITSKMRLKDFSIAVVKTKADEQN